MSRLMKFNPNILISLLTLIPFINSSLIVYETKPSENPSSEQYRLLNGLEYRTSPCGDDNKNTYF